MNWTTVACAGNFCGKTLDHPKHRAMEAVAYLDDRFGENLKNIEVRVNFSCCPNGCARHLIADIGLQGIQLKTGDTTIAGYNLYLKGNEALGKLIQRGLSAEQTKFALANLIEAYLKNGSAQTFNAFYSQKSIAELQAIVNQKTVEA